MLYPRMRNACWGFWSKSGFVPRSVWIERGTVTDALSDLFTLRGAPSFVGSDSAGFAEALRVQRKTIASATSPGEGGPTR